MSDQDMQMLVQVVERDLLAHIVENLKARAISKEEAQKLAQDFLKLLPPHDKKDLLEKLKKLSAMHPTALATYYDMAIASYENERDRALHEMAAHIKQGNIEQALTVAKGVGAK